MRATVGMRSLPKVHLEILFSVKQFLSRLSFAFSNVEAAFAITDKCHVRIPKKSIHCLISDSMIRNACIHGD